MTVNPGVARFQQHAHETLAQMQDTLRTFQRVWVLLAELTSYPLRTSFCRKASQCGVRFVKGLKLSLVKVI
jgi:hypothetical protein